MLIKEQVFQKNTLETIESKTERPKERYISLEKRQQNFDELRLV